MHYVASLLRTWWGWIIQAMWYEGTVNSVGYHVCLANVYIRRCERFTWICKQWFKISCNAAIWLCKACNWYTILVTWYAIMLTAVITIQGRDGAYKKQGVCIKLAQYTPRNPQECFCGRLYQKSARMNNFVDNWLQLHESTEGNP